MDVHWQPFVSRCYYCQVFSTGSLFYRLATTARYFPLTVLCIALLQLPSSVHWQPLVSSLLQLPGSVHWQHLVSSLLQLPGSVHWQPLVSSLLLLTGIVHWQPLVLHCYSCQVLYHWQHFALLCTTARYCSLAVICIVLLKLYCPLIALCITLLQLQGIVSLATIWIALLLQPGIVHWGSYLYRYNCIVHW